jgi:ribosomal-protein-alanine N-acetyltransferase
MLDESHITTIAVRPNLKHRGLGEELMIALSDLSIAIGADRMTLEVRVSNYEAQNLYRKFGFHEEGVRRRYYSDNNEDALIMWSEQLKSPEFTERLARIRQEIQEKVHNHPLPPPNWTNPIEA